VNSRSWAGIVLALAVLVGVVGWWLRRGPGPAPAVGRHTAARPLDEPDATRPTSVEADAPSPPVLAPSNTAAPTTPPAPTAGDAGAHVLLHATWGSGPDQLGRDRPREANPEAPMSLAADSRGQLLVLDQVNRRLVRYGRDGRPLGNVPLSVRAAQDIAVAGDGTIAVLDRLGDRTIALVGPDGQPRGTLALVGRGITEGGGVTGVFVDRDTVYVEREHGPLVRVGRTDGTADPERDEIPGRPTRDGLSYISATLVDADTGRFAINSVDRATQQHRFTRAFEMGLSVRGILLLDTDRAGTIYVALLTHPRGDPSERPTFTIRLLCVDPLQGRPLGQSSLPVSVGAEETFRDFTVLDDGGVLYAFRNEQGVTIQQADCR